MGPTPWSGPRPRGECGPRKLVDFIDGPSRALAQVRDWHDMAAVIVADTSDDGLGGYLGYLKGAAWREMVPAWMAAALQLRAEVKLAERVVGPLLLTLDAGSADNIGDKIEDNRDRVDGL